MLYVGSEDPRKNVPMLLRAFAMARRELPDLMLLKVGAAAFPEQRLRHLRLCRELGIADAVRLLSWGREWPQLAGLIAVIMVVAKALSEQVGAAGLYLLAAISGVADVDALTLSMARFAGVQVGLPEAGRAILVAASVNTVSKAAMAAAVGGTRLGTLVGGLSAAALAALGVTFLILP